MPNRIQMLYICIAFATACILTFTIMSKSVDVTKLNSATSCDINKRFKRNVTNLLDGCFHVYLDVGSNVGIQVRKIFEPQLFPNATALEFYDKYFGPLSSRREKGVVCVVGFEPNPGHVKKLKGIASMTQSRFNSTASILNASQSF